MGGGFVSGYVWGLPAVSPVYPTINFWNKGKWEWGLGHLLFEIIEGLQYHMCPIFRTFVVNWRHNQWAREILPSRKMHIADSLPICSWDKCEYAKCCFCQACWCDVNSQTYNGRVSSCRGGAIPGRKEAAATLAPADRTAVSIGTSSPGELVHNFPLTATGSPRMATSQPVPIHNRKVRHPQTILAQEEEKSSLVCQLLY